MNNKLERILDLFTQINNIPRKSKNEKAISEWLVCWAKDNGFKVERDSFLDVLIQVPASKGYEDKETIIFQGHMDMVCEKTPESKHNFETDPIQMFQEDGWLKAKDTSLGADNGIALAIAMALATDKDVKHPTLELLFTVDEETGLTGAVNLKTNWLTGKKLINIDSEDEGVFTVGCAGGRDANITINSDTVKNCSYDSALNIVISGLSGGHSGVEINKEKANANIILARLLKELKINTISFDISKISGGSAHNAISRNSNAVIVVNQKDITMVISMLSELIESIKLEFKHTDPNMKLELLQLPKQD